MTFLMGLDLGQANDYTALTITEPIAQPSGPQHYHTRHIERFPLGTSYPDIVRRLREMVRRPELDNQYMMVADQTGVGRPVIDMLLEAGLVVLPVTITGGNAVSGDDFEGYHVPKRDLVSSLQVALQSRRLKFAEGLPAAQLLVKELLDFQVKITLSANDTYGAWREGSHDDLTLSLALAIWYAELRGSGPLFWAAGSDGDAPELVAQGFTMVSHTGPIF